MIYRTLKAALVVAALTVAASQWLYSQADRHELERLVRNGGPLTTGSVSTTGARADASGVASLAAVSRLDPCELPPRR
ncbi:MAG: hypothetical protein EA385_06355 [Salinarimonadaceae bacterium]|nr:MAG: hypothetical protein EA385_06355 [Salinarimonadaceae bacterium]